MDACARGLLMAEKMIEDGPLGAIVRERYAGWEQGGRTAPSWPARSARWSDLAACVDKDGLDPQPEERRRQEALERLLNGSI